MSLFKKATKKDSKARVALCGPSGSGKTFTGLTIAKYLSGGGQVAVIDTERGSASKYADLFEFDCYEPTKFDPRELIDHINQAIESSYKVVFIDSLSHYWMGKGGELEIVDSISKRSQNINSFNAWREVTPIHNQLVDTLIGSPIHIIVSMRTKTEWIVEKNEKGKSVPRKIGMAPVMRDGIEYEFDVFGDLDQENTLTVTKSRCSQLSGQVIHRPGKDMAETLLRWLKGEKVQQVNAVEIIHANAHSPEDYKFPIVSDPIELAFESASTNDGIKLIWTALSPDQKRKYEAKKNEAKERIAKSVPVPVTAPPQEQFFPDESLGGDDPGGDDIPL